MATNPTFLQVAQKTDRLLIAILVVLLILSLLHPHQAIASLLFVGDSVLQTFPFLILSILAAAYAKATGADNLIAHTFSGNLRKTIPLAALVGAFSPFCSCGVIPLIAALLSIGIPLAPVMAFWLSSPLMDPSMFALTLGTLGPSFAVAKTLATVLIGLIGGFSILLLNRFPVFKTPLKETAGNGGCGGSKIRNPKAVVWRFWQDNKRTESFWKGSRDSTFFLGKWLIFAFLLESLMVAYIPDTLIQTIAGPANPLAIPSAALVGVPAYLNGYAALPLVDGLIEKGMDPGAGMAFLIAGGATSLPAAIAVYAIARKPVFFAYLAFALTGALLSGLVYGVIT